MELDLLEQEFNSRVKDRLEEINRVRRAIINPRPKFYDTPERMQAFLRMQSDWKPSHQTEQTPMSDGDDNGDRNDGPNASGNGQNWEFDFQERIIVNNDLLSVETLELGMKRAKSVGMILKNGVADATGFLIADGILMTNAHVFPSASHARHSSFRLEFVENEVGEYKKFVEFKIAPETFFFVDLVLDVAIVAIKSESETTPMRNISEYDYNKLIEQTGKIVVGHPVNIIQHPEGRTQRLSIHNSHLVSLKDADDEQGLFCLYTADTLKGSSGSPVYNRHWEIIALHSRGLPKFGKNNTVALKNGTYVSYETARKREDEIVWECNVGYRISKIIKSFKAASFDEDAHQNIQQRILESWILD